MGDTVRIEGFTQAQILNWLGQGIKTKGKANPYYFNKNGDLAIDSKKYKALSNKQKEIVSNIKGTINSTKVFTIEKASGSTVVSPPSPNISYRVIRNGEEVRVNSLTLNDCGGAITQAEPDGSGNVRITMASELLSGKGGSVEGVSGKQVDNVSYAILHHELGGHGYFKYVLNYSQRCQSGEAIQYDNKVRKLNGLELRQYQELGSYQHENPNIPFK